MRETKTRENELGFSDAGLALYDAVVPNCPAVLERGGYTLKEIARDRVRTVRDSATINWSLKESAGATIPATLRRLLAHYDYPPDGEDRVLGHIPEQAGLCAQEAT